MDGPRTTLFISLGCLIGAALLVFVAGIFIGMTGPEGGDSPIGPTQLVSLAGLSGIVSVLTGSLTALFGAQ
jgi:hypothetical protein